jgi:alpha-1,2-mannosyltransferase
MSEPLERTRLATILATLGGVALLVRLMPGVISGNITNRFEYDGGVMLGATLRMLWGSSPYADFDFVHPPGSLLLYAPIAALAQVLGEPGVFGILVAVTALAGVGNVVVIGILLSRHGMVAVIVGAGIYAVWPVAVFTERQVMLEPILNLCALCALLALRGDRESGAARLGGAWVAGALIGIALTVKYWAVVDVVLIAALTLARLGMRGLWRYLAAGTLIAGATSLPFFLRAPSAMWEQTVLAQLTRPATGTSLAERINMLSPLGSAPALDRFVPWWMWAALICGSLLLAAIPVVTAVRDRRSPRMWTDPVWWGALALMHSAVIALSSSFYDHYAAWALAPIALTTGYAASRLSGRRIVTGISIGAITGLMATQMAVPAGAQLSPMREWARGQRCIWADSTTLIAADAFRRNIAEGCPMTVDVFGTRLTLLRAAGNDAASADAALGARLLADLDRADAAIVSKDAWWVSGKTADALSSGFSRVAVLENNVLWQRATPPRE